MYIKPFSTLAVNPNNNKVSQPCTMRLGSKIANQMYGGVSPANSTLISGEYDEEDSFDVDPACDMKTDRFELNSDSKAFREPEVKPLEVPAE